MKQNKKRFRTFLKALSLEIREQKSYALVYFSLRMMVIVNMILQLFNGN